MANLVFENIRIEGTSIYMKSYPLTGVLALTGFIDSTSGTDVDHTFTKLFRYSLNGIEFSNWLNLTVPNITSIPIQQHHVIDIELRYVKNQPLGEEQLEVNSATIQYNLNPIEPQTFFDNTVFKQFFDTNEPQVLNWYINVLNKLYKRGLLADYIDRGKGGSDEDFIQFWSAVCKFFAYYVVLAREFGNYYENELLLFEYLKQKGLKVSELNTLNELNYLMGHYHEEIRKRGTINIALKKEDGALIDGEILRLLWYDKERDEFVFNPRLPQHSSWNVGNSSPLFKGLLANENANKYSNVIENIGDYTGGVVETKIENPNEKTVKVSSSFQYNKKIKVDSTFDYQLFFNAKTSGRISVVVKAYDINEDEIDIFSYKTGAVANNALTNAPLYRSDKYLPISIMVFNSERPLFAQNTTSIKQGNDLKMDPQTVWLDITISVTSGELYFDQLKFLPNKTPYSHGLIQTNNIIDAFIVNHNNELNLKEIEQFIVRYLIPYNSHLLLTNADNATRLIDSDENEDHPIKETVWLVKDGYCDTLAWRGIDPVCEVKITGWVPEEETAYCERQIAVTTTTIKPTTTTTTTKPTEIMIATYTCGESSRGTIEIKEPKRLKLRIKRLTGGPVSYSCQIANSSVSGVVAITQSEQTFISNNVLQPGLYSYAFPAVNCKDGTMIVYISLINEI